MSRWYFEITGWRFWLVKELLPGFNIATKGMGEATKTIGEKPSNRKKV